ncbi:MAG: site-2 protease family protein [Kiritimatiellia bacterium]
MFHASFLQIALMLAGLVLAVMIHEVAHGWVAFRCGDPTAKIMGRLTLNPLKHIDKYGSIIVPAVLLLVNSPALFGWAKPVPINLNRCRNPKDALFQVSIAGPMSNLLQAILALLMLKLTNQAIPWFSFFLMCYAQTNIMLMAFNLIPIPPLDGSRVLLSLLPPQGQAVLLRMERYSMFILAIFLFTGVLDPFLRAIQNGFCQLAFRFLS